MGRGASVADYDGDGDLDVAVLVHGGALRLARNDGGSRRGWVRVVLRSEEAPSGEWRSTTWATGARVTLTVGETRQIREVGGQSSYLSQEPPGEVFFGVGDAMGVDRLHIRWPSGLEQTLEDLPARATVRVVEGAPAVVLGAP